MPERYQKIRVKSGYELPESPDNKRPGQWQYDSDWYPLGGTPEKPKKLGRSWEVVPEGAAQTGLSFFTMNGECLVEVEPYEGPTAPHEVAGASLTYGGRTFASVDELVAYVQKGDPDERTRQIRARWEELGKLDRTALLNEARTANITAGPNSNEETLRKKLIDAQFGEGASLTAPGPVGTTVSGEPKPPGA